ncbi:hypothetical protein EVAR_31993_1 [Eumeta japonica]|uniref:Uncharacterized protein n=1 Tax=Eumeta variegata TaxID=151549 RepID=A0A4C1VV20_EUMVA|nr:hypothetical protein EVAR_31993_1 [Eumeta japonica]
MTLLLYQGLAPTKQMHVNLRPKVYFIILNLKIYDDTEPLSSKRAISESFNSAPPPPGGTGNRSHVYSPCVLARYCQDVRVTDLTELDASLAFLLASSYLHHFLLLVFWLPYAR